MEYHIPKRYTKTLRLLCLRTYFRESRLYQISAESYFCKFGQNLRKLISHLFDLPKVPILRHGCHSPGKSWNFSVILETPEIFQNLSESPENFISFTTSFFLLTFKKKYSALLMIINM